MTGKQRTRNSWHAMRDRCLNSRNERYHRYGGRGIDICPEWNTFAQFYLDMGDRPEGYSLERVDNDKGYERGNCKWALPKEQSNNTRRCVFIEHRGKRQTVAQWSRETGIRTATLRARIRRGWTIAQVFNPNTERGAKRPRLPRPVFPCLVEGCNKSCPSDLCTRHRQQRLRGKPLTVKVWRGIQKLRESDVRAIRDACALGQPHNDLALKFGVSRSTIGDIKRRHSWRNI